MSAASCVRLPTATRVPVCEVASPFANVWAMLPVPMMPHLSLLILFLCVLKSSDLYFEVFALFGSLAGSALNRSHRIRSIDFRERRKSAEDSQAHSKAHLSSSRVECSANLLRNDCRLLTFDDDSCFHACRGKPFPERNSPASSPKRDGCNQEIISGDFADSQRSLEAKISNLALKLA